MQKVEVKKGEIFVEAENRAVTIHKGVKKQKIKIQDITTK